jgi:outer membrane protein
VKVTKLAIALLAATGLSAIATSTMAYEAGDWLVRGRIINVKPNDDSGPLTLNGLDSGLQGVNVDSDTILELDITYMVDRNWGIELILSYSEHTLAGEKGWASLGDVIEVKALPPTLTLQYHFAPDSNIRPYISAGVNYTYFFDEEVAGSELPSAEAKVKLEDYWSLVAQAGVDIAINDDWFVNLDVKYIQMDTTAKFSNVLGDSNSAEIDADIDPFVYGNWSRS